MKRLALLALATVAAGCGGPGYQQQITDLRDDSGLWYTTVLVPSHDGADARRMRSWFAKDATLAQMTDRTRYSVLAPGDALYDRIAKQIGRTGVTAVVVQRPDGKVAYSASGANLPGSAESLGVAVREGCLRCRRNQPGPQVDVDIRRERPERDQRDGFFPLDPVGPRQPAPTGGGLGPAIALGLGLAAVIGVVAAVVRLRS